MVGDWIDHLLVLQSQYYSKFFGLVAFYHAYKSQYDAKMLYFMKNVSSCNKKVANI